MARKSVLIISYVPPYNRQGRDLAECLCENGYDASLVQMNVATDKTKKVFGVKCIPPKGIFHKAIMLWNIARFVQKSLLLPKDIVVVVGKPALGVGGLFSLVFRSKLVWYSLEFSRLRCLDRFVYQHFVKGYIDVEENRRDAIFREYGKKDVSLVCHNMPRSRKTLPSGGKLRAYLSAKYGVGKDCKIAIYAGSYQKYACLDKIVEASSHFPENVKLVLMTYGLPERLASASPNCIVIPPVNGEDFYDWLADADCALLPYESKDDFNVLNCSPQKLFDCYVAGIPFVASDRPLVRRVLEADICAGELCDFTSGEDIVGAVGKIINRKTIVSAGMRRLYLERFNYGAMSGRIADLFGQL